MARGRGRAATVMDRVAAVIALEGLLEPGRPALVLVSGGADSTLAAVALAELGYPLALLHVRHNLRGQASELDAERCRELSQELGAAYLGVPGEVPAGGNLEARLRDLRRAAALEHAKGRPLVTGHTASDRAETVLLRLASSPSAAGAFGALPPSDGPWRRPLLTLTRAEVRSELARRSIPWRDDPTNEERAANARVGVRLDALAALERVNPAAVKNLLAASGEAAAAMAFVDAAVGELAGSAGGVRRAAGMQAPPILARRALTLAARDAGVLLDHRDAEQIRRRLDGVESVELSLRGGGVALLDAGCVRFEPPRS